MELVTNMGIPGAGKTALRNIFEDNGWKVVDFDGEEIASRKTADRIQRMAECTIKFMQERPDIFGEDFKEKIIEAKKSEGDLKDDISVEEVIRQSYLKHFSTDGKGSFSATMQYLFQDLAKLLGKSIDTKERGFVRGIEKEIWLSSMGSTLDMKLEELMNVKEGIEKKIDEKYKILVDLGARQAEVIQTLVDNYGGKKHPQNNIRVVYLDRGADNVLSSIMEQLEQEKNTISDIENSKEYKASNFYKKADECVKHSCNKNNISLEQYKDDASKTINKLIEETTGKEEVSRLEAQREKLVERLTIIKYLQKNEDAKNEYKKWIKDTLNDREKYLNDEILPVLHGNEEYDKCLHTLKNGKMSEEEFKNEVQNLATKPIIEWNTKETRSCSK